MWACHMGYSYPRSRPVLECSVVIGLLRQDWPFDGGTVEMEGLAPSGRWMESRTPHYAIPNSEPDP